MKRTELLARLLRKKTTTPDELTARFGESWREPMESLVSLRIVRQRAPGTNEGYFVTHWNGEHYGR